MDYFLGLLNINLNWWSSIRGQKKLIRSTTMPDQQHLAIKILFVLEILMYHFQILLQGNRLVNQRTLLSWLIRQILLVTCIHSRDQLKEIQVVAGRIWYHSLEYLVQRDSFVLDHCLLKPGFTWSHSNHKRNEWSGRLREKTSFWKKWMEEFLFPLSFLFLLYFSKDTSCHSFPFETHHFKYHFGWEKI